MNGAQVFKGRCLCGAVELEVPGRPVVMGFCHCSACREWTAAPFTAFAMWKLEALGIARGEDQIGSFQKTERTLRKWCRSCGGHLFAEHPTWGLVQVYAGVLQGLRFDPAVHLNYAGAVLRVRDGLPKMKDMPAELGGTGIRVPE